MFLQLPKNVGDKNGAKNKMNVELSRGTSPALQPLHITAGSSSTSPTVASASPPHSPTTPTTDELFTVLPETCSKASALHVVQTPETNFSRYGLKHILCSQLVSQLDKVYFCWALDGTSTESIRLGLEDLVDTLDSTTHSTHLGHTSEIAALLRTYCEQQRLRSRCCAFILWDVSLETLSYFISNFCPSWGAHVIVSAAPGMVLQGSQGFLAAAQRLISSVQTIKMPAFLKDEPDPATGQMLTGLEKFRMICESSWIPQLLARYNQRNLVLGGGSDFDNGWVMKAAKTVQYSPFYLRMLMFTLAQLKVESYELYQRFESFLNSNSQSDGRSSSAPRGDDNHLIQLYQHHRRYTSPMLPAGQRTGAQAIIRLFETAMHPDDVVWAHALAILPPQIPLSLIFSQGARLVLIEVGALRPAASTTGALPTQSAMGWVTRSFQKELYNDLTEAEKQAACKVIAERCKVLNDMYSTTRHGELLKLHDKLCAAEIVQSGGVTITDETIAKAKELLAAVQGKGNHTNNGLKGGERPSPGLGGDSHAPTGVPTADDESDENSDINTGDQSPLGAGMEISRSEVQIILGDAGASSESRRTSCNSAVIVDDSNMFTLGIPRRNSGAFTRTLSNNGGNFMFTSSAQSTASVTSTHDAATWARWKAYVVATLTNWSWKNRIGLPPGSLIDLPNVRTFNDVTNLPSLPEDDSQFTVELAALYRAYALVYLQREEPLTAAAALERALCIYMHSFSKVSTEMDKRYNTSSGPVRANNRTGSPSDASLGTSSFSNNKKSLTSVASMRMMASFRKPHTTNVESGLQSFLYGMLLLLIEKTYRDIAYCYCAGRMEGLAEPFVERSASVLQVMNGGRRDTPARSMSLVEIANIKMKLSEMESRRRDVVQNNCDEIDEHNIKNDRALTEVVKAEVNETQYALAARSSAEEALRALSVTDPALTGTIAGKLHEWVAIGHMYTQEDKKALDQAILARDEIVQCQRSSGIDIGSLPSVFGEPAGRAKPPTLVQRQQEINWVKDQLPNFYTALASKHYNVVNDLLDRSMLFAFLGYVPIAPDVMIVCESAKTKVVDDSTENDDKAASLAASSPADGVSMPSSPSTVVAAPLTITDEIARLEMPPPVAHPNLELRTCFTPLELARHYGGDWRKKPVRYCLPIHELLLHMDAEDKKALQLLSRLLSTRTSLKSASPHDLRTPLHIAIDRDLMVATLLLLKEGHADPTHVPATTLRSTRNGLSTCATIEPIPNTKVVSPIASCKSNDTLLLLLATECDDAYTVFTQNLGTIIERLAASDHRQQYLTKLFSAGEEEDEEEEQNVCDNNTIENYPHYHHQQKDSGEKGKFQSLLVPLIAETGLLSSEAREELAGICPPASLGKALMASCHDPFVVIRLCEKLIQLEDEDGCLNLTLHQNRSRSMSLRGNAIVGDQINWAGISMGQLQTPTQRPFSLPTSPTKSSGGLLSPLSGSHSPHHHPGFVSSIVINTEGYEINNNQQNRPPQPTRVNDELLKLLAYCVRENAMCTCEELLTRFPDRVSVDALHWEDSTGFRRKMRAYLVSQGRGDGFGGNAGGGETTHKERSESRVSEAPTHMPDDYII